MVTEIKRVEILLAEGDADAELVRDALVEHRVNCSLRVVRDGAQAIAVIDEIDKDPKAFNGSLGSETEDRLDSSQTNHRGAV